MKTKILLVCLFAMARASLADASPITLPTGLAPGSTYFLAFATADIRVANSTNILDYDTFVTAQANLEPTLAALGTTWSVIGSTATVDAITHIGVTGPVYNFAGELVATGPADLWNGTIDAPIAFNQYGQRFIESPFFFNLAFTGTNTNGLGIPGFTLGGLGAGAGIVTEQNGLWIAYEPFSGLEPNHFYGISGPLLTPSPEPGTIGLMLSALLLAGGTQRRWRQCFRRTSTTR